MNGMALAVREAAVVETLVETADKSVFGFLHGLLWGLSGDLAPTSP